MEQWTEKLYKEENFHISFLYGNQPQKNIIYRIFMTIWGRGVYFRFFFSSLSFNTLWTLKATFNDTEYEICFHENEENIFGLFFYFFGVVPLNNRRTVLIDHRLDTVN